MDSLQKQPTSKMIYDITFKSGSKETESVLYERLCKLYRLNFEKAERLIQNEQSKLESRGSSLDNYLFGTPKTAEETLRMFYRDEKGLFLPIDTEEHFNTFTLSEIAAYELLFRHLRIAISAHKTTLNFIRKWDLLPFTAEREPEELRGYALAAEESQALIKYYKLLNKCMYTKMRELLGLNKNLISHLQLELIMELEQDCLRELKGVLVNTSFVHFEDHKQVAEDNGAKVYVFSQK